SWSTARPDGLRGLGQNQLAFLVAVFLLVDFLAAFLVLAFFAGAFLAAVFLLVAFFEVAFLVPVLSAAGFSPRAVLAASTLRCSAASRSTTSPPPLGASSVRLTSPPSTLARTSSSTAWR